MKSAIDFCKLRNFYGYRYPKLQELYNKLFGADFENAHNAFSDISATVKCFWEMVKWGIITIPRTKAEIATNTDEDMICLFRVSFSSKIKTPDFTFLGVKSGVCFVKH